MRASFAEKALPDYLEWQRTDRKIADKINTLIIDTLRHPFDGLGKPEPLKHGLRALWSRRINKEHRLVYYVEDDEVIFTSCRGHYDDK